MLNEIIQWAALASIVVLLLGLLRQVSAIVPPSRRLPSGPQAGERLPSPLRDALERDPTHRGASGLLVFVSEGCAGCSRLLSVLEAGGSTQNLGDSWVLIVPRSDRGPFVGALEQAGFSILPDESGDFWRTLGVAATPTVMHIDPEGRITYRGVTQDVQQFAAHA